MWCTVFITLCCVSGLLTQAEAACPDGFELHGSSCYKALNLEASWAEAQMYCQILVSGLAIIDSAVAERYRGNTDPPIHMYCQILGSGLAIIDSAVEEDVVEGILSRLHHTHVDDTYWIAGTDIATEASWMWIGQGGVSSPIVGYSNWPRGGVPTDNRNHNCLVINHNGGERTTWDDAYCNTLHSFVCETQRGLAPVATTHSTVTGSTTTTESEVVLTIPGIPSGKQ